MKVIQLLYGPKRKSHLSLRLLVDPTTFAAAALPRGIQQAKDSYWKFGQGAEGYARRRRILQFRYIQTTTPWQLTRRLVSL